MSAKKESFTFRQTYFQVWLDDKVIQKDIHESGRPYESAMLDFMRDNDWMHGGTWIDAGANFGNHAMCFSCLADMVIALEPVPYNYELLIKNIAENKRMNIIPMPMAVGKLPGWANWEKSVEERWSQCRITNIDDAKMIRKSKGGVLPVIDIDSLNYSDVRVLKVDCEGMERTILEGAILTIREYKPEIFVEIFEEAELKFITGYLALNGYRLIERYNHAPTYHFSTNKSIPVTYKKP